MRLSNRVSGPDAQKAALRGLLIATTAFAALATPIVTMAKTVTLAMDVKLDQVAPEDEGMYRVGGYNLDRIAYDETKIDPVTHKVPITLLAHYIGGHWFPVETT